MKNFITKENDPNDHENQSHWNLVCLLATESFSLTGNYFADEKP